MHACRLQNSETCAVFSHPLICSRKGGPCFLPFHPNMSRHHQKTCLIIFSPRFQVCIFAPPRAPTGEICLHLLFFCLPRSVDPLTATGCRRRSARRRPPPRRGCSCACARSCRSRTRSTLPCPCWSPQQPSWQWRQRFYSKFPAVMPPTPATLPTAFVLDAWQQRASKVPPHLPLGRPNVRSCGRRVVVASIRSEREQHSQRRPPSLFPDLRREPATA